MIRIGVWGLIAYEAAARLAKTNAQMLEGHFPRWFLKTFEVLAQDASDPDAEANEYKGGLFGTVWNALDTLEKYASGHSEDYDDRDRQLLKKGALTVKAPVGCRIDLLSIPLRQEIIEICELFDENPYEAASAGAYLVIWNEDDPEIANAAWFHMGSARLCEMPENIADSEEIVSIGYITCSKDRLIINGDMIRYLTPYSRQMTDICARKKDRRSTDGKKR